MPITFRFRIYSDSLVPATLLSTSSQHGKKLEITTQGKERSTARSSKGVETANWDLIIIQHSRSAMKMIDVKCRAVVKFGARFARAACVSRASIWRSQLMAADSESLDIEALLDSVADDTMTQLMSELSSAASSYIGDREALKMTNFFDSTSTSDEGTIETRTCHWEADDEPSTSQERQCMSRVMFSEKSVSNSKLLQAKVTKQVPNVRHLQMQPGVQGSFLGNRKKKFVLFW